MHVKNQNWVPIFRKRCLMGETDWKNTTATVDADERIERCRRRFFDQWLSYQDLIFKCPEVSCRGKAKGAEEKGGKREKNGRGLGSPRGPRGPKPLTYPVGPVRQVSQYFGEGEGWHSLATFNGRGARITNRLGYEFSVNSASTVVESMERFRTKMHSISWLRGDTC